MLVNFSWIREGRLAGMGLPYPDAFEALEEAGVSAVLSLTEQPLVDGPAPDGFTLQHVPLVDFGVPSQPDLERCVAWIDEQLEADRGVAVHCFAGVGRTGTVLAAWMVAQGMDPEEVILEIRRLRPGSIETAGQADAVRDFAKRKAR